MIECLIDFFSLKMLYMLQLVLLKSSSVLVTFLLNEVHKTVDLKLLSKQLPKSFHTSAVKTFSLSALGGQFLKNLTRTYCTCSWKGREICV